MPIKDPDVNRVYQRDWQRALHRSWHRRRTCQDCGTKEKLAFGPKLVLCYCCKGKRQNAHLVKPPEVRRLITIKKYTKSHIRRSFKLPKGQLLPDTLAFMWADKLEEAIRLGLITKQKSIEEFKALDKKFLEKFSI